MELKDLIDIFFKTSDNINFYWNFYIGGAIAVFGWYGLRKEKLSSKTSIAVTIVYLALSALNLFVLIELFSFLKDISAEINASQTLDNLKTNGIKNYFINLNNDLSIKITIAIHIITDSSVIFVIWKNRIIEFLKSMKKNQKT